MKYGFGVDVGGMSVKLALFDESGKIHREWVIPTDTGDGGIRVIPDIAKGIEAVKSEFDLSARDLLGIGLGVPGPVREQRIVDKCVNIGWGVIDLAAEFANYTDIPIKAENDANVAALGEYWMGSGANYKSICLITLGTGIGGGIIIDGKILAGAHGAGGEIGHMPVPGEEERLCTCGKINCVEQYASAAAVERAYGEKCNIVFDLAKGGDEKAIAIIDDAVSKLSFSMGAIASVCDPEAFIIGGGMSKAGDYLLEKIRKAYPVYAFHACRGSDIILAKLGNSAGMYGAFRLLMTD